MIFSHRRRRGGRGGGGSGGETHTQIVRDRGRGGTNWEEREKELKGMHRA